MNLLRLLLLMLLIVSQSVFCVSPHGVYYAELQAFKERSDTKILFSEDAHPMLVAIQRDIAVYKVVNPLERFVNSLFLRLDVIVVTPDNFPLLYSCVDQICKQGKVAMPTVFITRKNSFFNAFAVKILKSNGCIVLGQELLSKLSDNAIEGIVAHEIGHIKYNHVNKIYALQAALFVGLALVTQYVKPGFWKKVSLPRWLCEAELCKFVRELFVFDLKFEATCFVSSLIAAFIINKRFEKEADKFACKTIGNTSGLIEFFEYLLQQDQLREEEFILIYDRIQQSQDDIPDDYWELMIRYYWAKADDTLFKLYKRLYYDTFFGAHPSHQARIDAAQKYLA